MLKKKVPIEKIMERISYLNKYITITNLITYSNLFLLLYNIIILFFKSFIIV